MRSIVLACALVAGTAPSLAAQDPEPLDLPVSLDRIREGLARPSLLDALRRQPDFRVEVEEQRPTFAGIFSPDAFDGGPVPPGGLYAYEQQRRLFPNAATPLFAFDALPLVRGLVSALGEARRARAAAAAREEVERAMAEFCAAQPDGGAGVVGCGAR